MSQAMEYEICIILSIGDFIESMGRNPKDEAEFNRWAELAEKGLLNGHIDWGNGGRYGLAWPAFPAHAPDVLPARPLSSRVGVAGCVFVSFAGFCPDWTASLSCGCFVPAALPTPGCVGATA